MVARILALDTSADACSVALQTDQQVISRFEIAPRKHTQLLLPMVDAVMQESGLKFEQLDALAFGRGPGSFAGIRIATGAAQGLALANDTPMIGISTLETIALSHFLEDRTCDRVLAALDARMDEIYWACFERIDGFPVALTNERVDPPAEVISDNSFLDFDLVGSGVRYLDQMPQQTQSQMRQFADTVMPDARVMLRLASKKWAIGDTLAIEEALPVYLRQGSWKKRNEQ